MATSSITKEFVIKDDKTCDKLIKAMEKSSSEPTVTRNYYEEGKEKLEQYFGR